MSEKTRTVSIAYGAFRCEAVEPDDMRGTLDAMVAQLRQLLDADPNFGTARGMGDVIGQPASVNSDAAPFAVPLQDTDTDQVAMEIVQADDADVAQTSVPFDLAMSLIAERFDEPEPEPEPEPERLLQSHRSVTDYQGGLAVDCERTDAAGRALNSDDVIALPLIPPLPDQASPDLLPQHQPSVVSRPVPSQQPSDLGEDAFLRAWLDAEATGARPVDQTTPSLRNLRTQSQPLPQGDEVALDERATGAAQVPPLRLENRVFSDGGDTMQGVGAEPVRSAPPAAHPVDDVVEEALLRKVTDLVQRSEEAHRHTQSRVGAEKITGPKDFSLVRLFAQTDSQLEGRDSRRRLSIMSYLKGAVASIRADREPAHSADLAAVPMSTKAQAVDRFRQDLEGVVRPRRASVPGQLGGRPEPLVRSAGTVSLDSTELMSDLGATVRPRRVRVASATDPDVPMALGRSEQP